MKSTFLLLFTFFIGILKAQQTCIHEIPANCNPSNALSYCQLDTNLEVCACNQTQSNMAVTIVVDYSSSANFISSINGIIQASRTVLDDVGDTNLVEIWGARNAADNNYTKIQSWISGRALGAKNATDYTFNAGSNTFTCGAIDAALGSLHGISANRKETAVVLTAAAASCTPTVSIAGICSMGVFESTLVGNSYNNIVQHLGMANSNFPSDTGNWVNASILISPDLNQYVTTQTYQKHTFSALSLHWCLNKTPTVPTSAPTTAPTMGPSKKPTAAPITPSPSPAPSKAPTGRPSKTPFTSSPTTPSPSTHPSKAPTGRPTEYPTKSPTSQQPCYFINTENACTNTPECNWHVSTSICYNRCVRPLDIIYVLDSSVSVSHNEWNNTIEWAARTMDLLGAKQQSVTRVAVISFDSTARLEYPLTNGVLSTAAAVTRSLPFYPNTIPTPGGQTFTFEALELAINEFKNSPNIGARTKFVVLISDDPPDLFRPCPASHPQQAACGTFDVNSKLPICSSPGQNNTWMMDQFVTEQISVATVVNKVPSSSTNFVGFENDLFCLNNLTEPKEFKMYLTENIIQNKTTRLFAQSIATFVEGTCNVGNSTTTCSSSFTMANVSECDRYTLSISGNGMTENLVFTPYWRSDSPNGTWLMRYEPDLAVWAVRSPYGDLFARSKNYSNQETLYPVTGTDEWQKVGVSTTLHKISGTIQCGPDPITPAPTFSLPPLPDACVIPKGILTNVKLGFLNGWTRCYDMPYSDSTTDAAITDCFTASGANQMFVGAFDNNMRSDIALGAFGDIVSLGINTPSSGPAVSTSVANPNVYWYRTREHAFGFAETPDIELNTVMSRCDVNNTFSHSRLCWVLRQFQIESGARVGTNLQVHDSSFQKQIWVADCPSTCVVDAFLYIQDPYRDIFVLQDSKVNGKPWWLSQVYNYTILWHYDPNVNAWVFTSGNFLPTAMSDIGTSCQPAIGINQCGWDADNLASVNTCGVRLNISNTFINCPFQDNVFLILRSNNPNITEFDGQYRKEQNVMRDGRAVWSNYQTGAVLYYSIPRRGWTIELKNVTVGGTDCILCHFLEQRSNGGIRNLCVPPNNLTWFSFGHHDSTVLTIDSFSTLIPTKSPTTSPPTLAVPTKSPTQTTTRRPTAAPAPTVFLTGSNGLIFSVDMTLNTNPNNIVIDNQGLTSFALSTCFAFQAVFGVANTGYCSVTINSYTTRRRMQQRSLQQASPTFNTTFTLGGLNQELRNYVLYLLCIAQGSPIGSPFHQAVNRLILDATGADVTVTKINGTNPTCLLDNKDPNGNVYNILITNTGSGGNTGNSGANTNNTVTHSEDNTWLWWILFLLLLLVFCYCVAFCILWCNYFKPRDKETVYSERQPLMEGEQMAVERETIWPGDEEKVDVIHGHKQRNSVQMLHSAMNQYAVGELPDPTNASEDESCTYPAVRTNPNLMNMDQGPQQRPRKLSDDGSVSFQL